MLNVIARANELLHTMPSSYAEILLEFSAEYKVAKEHLPDTDVLIDFIGDCPNRDKIRVSFSTSTDNIFITGDTVRIDEFQSFKDGLIEDEIDVSIHIHKEIVDGILSIYNIKSFSDFLSGRSVEQLLLIFTDLFNKCRDHITFCLMDVNGSLKTKSIAFSDSDVQWKDEWLREEQLKNCEDASIFLERNKIRLIPQDFTAIGPMEGPGLDRVRQIFGEIRNALSYVYVANTSSLVKEKAILQFDPSVKGYEFELKSLTDNEVMPRVFDWIFKDDRCVDKASIARKIISVYCRSEEEILHLDERVLSSIKSDYVIYQKNHADQYIEMKNKISGFIIDCVKQIQGLSHEMVEAIRNNFVAIIVFLMTVLLTDSIDVSQFMDRTVSANVIAVCWLFTGASALYLLITVITGEQKWRWLEQSYDDLKRNYKGVLDDRDIDEAFASTDSDGKKSEPLETSRKQYKGFRNKVIVIWIAAILSMTLFSGVLTKTGYSKLTITTKEKQSVSDMECESVVAMENDDLMESNDAETAIIC